MSIAGTHFHEAVLPGIELQAASLLLTSMPGGWLVQVTTQVSPVVVTKGWLMQLCTHTSFGTCNSCQPVSDVGGCAGQLLSAVRWPSASAEAALGVLQAVQAAALARRCQTCLVSRAAGHAASSLTGSESEQRQSSLIPPLLLQGINVCQAGASDELHSRWQPPTSSTISMAAALGSYLAVCSGSTVQLLDLNPQFGQVNIVQVFDFLQQVSAVSLFQAGKGTKEVSLSVQHKLGLLKLCGQCSAFHEDYNS